MVLWAEEHYPHLAELGNTGLLTCLWHQWQLNVLTEVSICRSHHIASIQDLTADSLDHGSVLSSVLIAVLYPPLPCWYCSSAQAD